MRLTGCFNSFAVVAIAVSFTLGCDDSGAPSLPPRSDMGSSDNSVQITQPTGGTELSAADDLDNDLSNGIQFRVTLAVGVAGEGTLQLNVADEMPQTQPAVTGDVTFEATLPGDRNGRYAITAALSPTVGDVVTATANVSVKALVCTVEISPQPSGGGCDLGSSADEDTETAGMQTTITARSNCPEVTFTVNNLPPVTQNTTEGETSLLVTLRDGENSITVSATDGVSEPAVVGPYPLVTRLTGPRVEANGLNENRTNAYLLTDGDLEGGLVYWTIRGRAVGVTPGENVQVTLEPALDNAPTEIRVDENGDIRLELAVARGAYYTGSLTLSGTDTCGESGSSAAYAITLDAVIPSIGITAPSDGALLVYEMDVDPIRAGAQIPVLVEIVDPRPATVDYSVSIECASVGGNSTFVDRARGPGDTLTRATLLDGDSENDQVLVTFQQSEVGEFICRAVLLGESNPGAADEVVWRAFFERPSFTVFSPAQAPTCISTDEVEIAGVGTSLDGNDAHFTATLTPEGAAPGEEGNQVALEPRGNDRYGVNLNAQTVPDGRYQVAISGQVLGQVDVGVDPQEFDIVVDRVPPSIEILSPGVDGVFSDEAPAIAGTQSVLSFQVCGAAGRTLQVDTLPALPGSPFALEVPAGAACAQIQIPAATVPLGDVTINAQVTDECGVAVQQSRVAAIPNDAREARITSPAAGNVNASVDSDGARAGCQFELEAIGQGLAEGAEFYVCTDVNQAPPSEACNGRASAVSGACRIVGSTANGARVLCPISLQDGAHHVSFVGIFGERIESAPLALNVDCQAPSVQAITIVEDGNQDGCVNAIERQNSGDVSNAARMTVRIQTEGIEDGRTVRVLTEDGIPRGSVAITNNQGDVVIELAEGSRTISIDGADAVGNPLPTEGVGMVTAPVQIDTQSPSPSLTNLVEGVCLNIDADEDHGSAGLQYRTQITTGRAAGQTVTAHFSIDGGQPTSMDSAADTLEFPQLRMDEGEHTVTVTVADACANLGSVNGFGQVGGQDDWSQPLPVSIRVDTIAPTLNITGLQPGTVLTAPDDADGNSTNGFQVDILAEVTPNIGLEEGQAIDVTINGAPAITEPSPVIVPANLAGPIPARINLAPGMKIIRLAAVDTCGNSTESEAVEVELNIPGCASVINTFAGNPQILGPTDGVRSGNELTLSIGGTVQLLDVACIGAPIQLLVDDVEAAAGLVPAGGQILFENVTLVEGARNIRLRVGPVAGNTLDSANQTLLVDLSAPTVVITQPGDGVNVLTDSAPGINGQQAIVQVSVSEAFIVTSRTAVLRVDGGQVGAETNVADLSPAQVTFSDVTLAAGTHTLQLCTSDGAGNTGCAQWTVNADPAAPAATADLTVQIVDSRQTAVSLDFTAPGDDGNGGGLVVQYAVRRADAPIADETAWQNAAATELLVAATVAPGGQESFAITGAGPGPLLADGLRQNVTHHLSIRAMDDAGRMGPLAQAIVDLQMPMEIVDLPTTTGNWSDTPFLNQGSMVVGLGDVDGDTIDDALIVASQSGGSTAQLVFGAQGGNSPVRLALNIPANIHQGFYGLGGVGLGDINGDSINDYAVIGVQAGFAGSAIALYFGCIGCNNAELAAPDALIFANGNRLFSVVASAGNFNQRAGDNGAINDIFLGGTISAQANPTTAFVVAGRQNWPLLPNVLTVDEDPAAGGEGITVLGVPDGKAGYAGAGVGDLNGDGFGDLLFSAGTPSVVYRFNGGADLGDEIDYEVANPNTTIVAHTCSADPDGYGEHIMGGLDLDGDAQGRPNYAISDGINRRVIVFDETDQSIDCFGRSRSLFGNVVDFAGDIDGDGFTDLIVSHSGEQFDAFVFYNDGMGRFGDGAAEAPREAHIILDQPALPKIGVAGLGDMNGDGRDDLGALVKQPGAGNLELVIYY